jgi:hypothetical protein
MDKIYFDNSTYIWKTKLNFTKYKNIILNECNEFCKEEMVWDNYSVLPLTTINNFKLDGKILPNPKSMVESIINLSTQKCIELYTNAFNNISVDCWINIVKVIPKQTSILENKIQMHIHSNIQKEMQKPIPNYTWVYYVQMPDNLVNNDGVLFVEGENKKIYDFLPIEDDIIIMNGNLPHVPNGAFNSTKDRIVLAGNVSFQYIKNKKSVL